MTKRFFLSALLFACTLAVAAISLWHHTPWVMYEFCGCLDYCIVDDRNVIVPYEKDSDWTEPVRKSLSDLRSTWTSDEFRNRVVAEFRKENPSVSVPDAERLFAATRTELSYSRPAVAVRTITRNNQVAAAFVGTFCSQIASQLRSKNARLREGRYQHRFRLMEKLKREIDSIKNGVSARTPTLAACLDEKLKLYRKLEEEKRKEFAACNVESGYNCFLPSLRKNQMKTLLPGALLMVVIAVCSLVVSVCLCLLAYRANRRFCLMDKLRRHGYKLLRGGLALVFLVAAGYLSVRWFLSPDLYEARCRFAMPDRIDSVVTNATGDVVQPERETLGCYTDMRHVAKSLIREYLEGCYAGRKPIDTFIAGQAGVGFSASQVSNVFANVKYEVRGIFVADVTLSASAPDGRLAEEALKHMLGELMAITIKHNEESKAKATAQIWGKIQKLRRKGEDFSAAQREYEEALKACSRYDRRIEVLQSPRLLPEPVGKEW